MTILVIEDNPSDRKRLSLVLRTGGDRVLEQAPAEAALEQIKTQWPGVTLLDLKLPGMDGLALARRCKAEPATRAIPIVTVTAAPELFSRQAALAAGCEAFIRKRSTRANNPGQRLTAMGRSMNVPIVDDKAAGRLVGKRGGKGDG